MTPLRISLIYATAGALWIIFSDRIVDGLGFDLPTITLIQTAKGWFFILVTASLLYLFVRRAVTSVERYHTDREKARDLLRQSEYKYKILLENANSIILRRDALGRVTYLNEFAQQFFGYREDEILGRNIVGTLVPETESTGRDLRLMIEDITNHPDRYVNNINENMRRNGERVWIAWTNKPVHDEQDKTIEMLCIGNDITERRRAEESLRESERHYRALIETTNTGYVIIDSEGRVLDANAEYVRLTGEKELTDIRGRSVVEWTADDQKTKNAAAVRECLDRGHIRNLELNYRDSRGQVIPVEINATVVEKDGETRILTLCRDISHRRKAESERQLLEERLRRAEKMEALGTLAGGVAHDLNNVLGVLVGYSEILTEKITKADPLRRYADNILQSGLRGAAIIQDLLTLARRGVAVSDVVNLNAIVSQFFETIEFEKCKADHPRVIFKAELDQGLPNITGSSVHLEKTVMNLVANAVESITDQGEVLIRTEHRCLYQPIKGYDVIGEGDYVVMTVADSGKGISPHDREKIFEPFFTRKAMGRSGTGLGLTVVWGTVKDHNGYIDVQSEEGQGSTFSLYFPATEQPVHQVDPSLPVETYLGRGETILVVDDLLEQRELAALLLKRLGYDVSAASSGEEAVAYLRNRTVDLLVVDMIMDPGIDGLETYRQICAINPRQKAIIVSGFSETDRVRKTLAMGAGAYVRKPYTLEKLGLAVRKEMDRA
jgi:two-component system, cell cycle sensor histidine kinase and response regulator CckA